MEKGDEKKEVQEKSAYYEKKLEEYNNLDKDFYEFLKNIDFNEKAESDNDASSAASLQKQKELFDQGIKKEKSQKRLEKAIKYFMDKKHLAEQFLQVQPLFYDNSRIWWVWNFEHLKWEMCDEIDIVNAISDESHADTVSSKERTEILEALKQVSRKHRPKEIEPSWIQFKDTIVDIQTNQRFRAGPEYFVTNPIPWSLGESKETPEMDKIFKDWVGEENVRLLYEIMAYCMLPDYPLHRIFCFVGSGMNGKSKYLELLRKFIGDLNTCSTELDTLLGSRFEVSRLYKKLVCQMGETNFSEMGKTSMLKKLSGGDYINFEHKNKDPFEGVNYAKILISTNTLPATTDKTIGFYRRWVIIDFPHQFSEKKDILSEIPEKEMNNVALKLLDYLEELLQKREFHNEGDIEERMQKYEERSNPMEKFLKEYCDTSDPDAYMTKSELSKKLNDWLKSNGYRTLSDVEITKRMKKQGFEESREFIDWYSNGKIEKKRVRCWLHIKISSSKA